jgi:hypothetical protein
MCPRWCADVELIIKADILAKTTWIDDFKLTGLGNI